MGTSPTQAVKRSAVGQQRGVVISELKGGGAEVFEHGPAAFEFGAVDMPAQERALDLAARVLGLQQDAQRTAEAVLGGLVLALLETRYVAQRF